MTDLSKILLFRMTHVANVQHILTHGITHHSSPKRNPEYVSIGDSSLISSRSGFVLPTGRALGDYIPFYFGARMPMLYVIQKGYNGVAVVRAEDIVYCVTSVSKIIESGLNYAFTNGHAIDSFSQFFTEADVMRIQDIVDFNAVGVTDWKVESDLDLKRRKQAEFLVLGDIPPQAVLGFAVFNHQVQDFIMGLQEINDKIVVVRPNNYF